MPDSQTSSTTVVTFRVREKSSKRLEAETKKLQVIGVDSAHKLARKLTLDYLAGDLIYLDASKKYGAPAG